MTKQLITVALGVMTTLVALMLLWQFRIVVVYVLISLTLAATVRPLVKHLDGRKLIVRVAWIAIYVAVLGGLGGLFVLPGRGAGNLRDPAFGL
jgi:predicted PurR-regulated permease PerM